MAIVPRRPDGRASTKFFWPRAWITAESGRNLHLARLKAGTRFGELTMNILIVDDNVALGETLAMMLETLGHRPSLALTGYAGVEAAKTSLPRLVLLDLGLPDIDGFEVCRLIRAVPGLETTLIVAQSGRDDAEDVERAMTGGFDRFIVKPAPFEALEELIALADA